MRWIDTGSLIVAIVYAWIMSRVKGYNFLSHRTGLDVAKGIAFLPLLLLVVSILYAPLLEALFESNKVILSMAGTVALLALLEDR
jgi:hypothetical protein